MLNSNLALLLAAAENRAAAFFLRLLWKTEAIWRTDSFAKSKEFVRMGHKGLQLSSAENAILRKDKKSHVGSQNCTYLKMERIVK